MVTIEFSSRGQAVLDSTDPGSICGISLFSSLSVLPELPPTFESLPQKEK